MLTKKTSKTVSISAIFCIFLGSMQLNAKLSNLRVSRYYYIAVYTNYLAMSS